MLEVEKNLLNEEYKNTLQHTQKNPILASLAKEKVAHSYQVLDAGNYILKNENVFKNWNSKQIKEARIALLLHDIGRFQEIINKALNPNQHSDHGILGYNLLANTTQYNNPRITIPIKHHGHMIEELYADPEFYTIEDPQIKYEIEKITFLVRDADKIANFKLLSESDEHIWSLFYITKHPQNKTPISPIVYNTFLKQQVILKKDVVTNSDFILLLICWIFDLNYNSSFEYLRINKCFEFLIEELRNSNNDMTQQKTIEQTIQNYLNIKNQQLWG